MRVAIAPKLTCRLMKRAFGMTRRGSVGCPPHSVHLRAARTITVTDEEAHSAVTLGALGTHLQLDPSTTGSGRDTPRRSCGVVRLAGSSFTSQSTTLRTQNRWSTADHSEQFPQVGAFCG